MLAFIVVWKQWNWNPLAAAALVIPFLVVDVAFLGANLLKIVHGGWLPLVIGALLVVVMITWRRGSRILFDKTRRLEVPLADLIQNLEKHPAAAHRRHRRSSSPAIRRARRPRCCTASSTSRFCTSATSS